MAPQDLVGEHSERVARVEREAEAVLRRERRPPAPALAPRSSRAVTVSLALDSPVPAAGTYRGTIQADGAPGLWLPLEVSVA